VCVIIPWHTELFMFAAYVGLYACDIGACEYLFPLVL
jgi:hypothetical protein